MANLSKGVYMINEVFYKKAIASVNGDAKKSYNLIEQYYIGTLEVIPIKSILRNAIEEFGEEIVLKAIDITRNKDVTDKNKYFWGVCKGLLAEKNKLIAIEDKGLEGRMIVKKLMKDINNPTKIRLSRPDWMEG
jgi:hypothetical protein